LPPQAAHLEAVRRRVLDRFSAWGYELVITPMVEYLESLLTGTGRDLDLKTFKVTDQVSGRMMGIRADITPQAARIDAHSLKRDGIVRLCYAGTVLHAQADNQLASRTPISVGAELFGETGTRGDLEIVSLMIEVVKREGISPVHIELGDVGIFRELARRADLGAADEERLFELIQQKSGVEIEAAVKELGIASPEADKITALAALYGGEEVLALAQESFSSNPGIMARLESLKEVADGLKVRFPDIDIYYDLSELRGYNYHTGIVFAAYMGSSGQRLAKGGRYDHVGEVFGRARAATGFDVDLKGLASHSVIELDPGQRVLAPLLDNREQGGRWTFISQLREEGYIVIESDVAAGCELKVVDV
ncbi:MAG: ATP phosphoribosyltransferase regulatory subunit, partial [Pseudomonadales bacterium]